MNIAGQALYFQYSWVLILLLLIPLIAYLWYFKNREQASLRVAHISSKEAQEPTPWQARLRTIIFPLLLAALGFLILALSRPQFRHIEEIITSEGIDMVISMDISGSMLAEDFQPNRMEASKEKAIEFVEGRKSDRIGLVIFAGESYTLSPITSDKNSLIRQIESLRIGMLEDGTAIGMGLATAVDRLKDSEAKSRIIILMTDGENNTGTIDPVTALEIAKAFGIKVYTVGVGTIGEALFPVPSATGVITKEMMPVRIDEEILQQIAAETGGKYYRAVDNESLESIYKDIDQLEKTEIESIDFQHIKDLFYYPLFVTILLMALALSVQWFISPSLTEE